MFVTQERAKELRRLLQRGSDRLGLGAPHRGRVSCVCRSSCSPSLRPMGHQEREHVGNEGVILKAEPEVYGLDPNRLYASYFCGDEESLSCIQCGSGWQHSKYCSVVRQSCIPGINPKSLIRESKSLQTSQPMAVAQTSRLPFWNIESERTELT